jgi:hypothetical protein
MHYALSLKLLRELRYSKPLTYYLLTSKWVLLRPHLLISTSTDYELKVEVSTVVCGLRNPSDWLGLLRVKEKKFFPMIVICPYHSIPLADIPS